MSVVSALSLSLEWGRENGKYITWRHQSVCPNPVLSFYYFTYVYTDKGCLFVFTFLHISKFKRHFTHQLLYEFIFNLLLVLRTNTKEILSFCSKKSFYQIHTCTHIYYYIGDVILISNKIY